MTAKIETHHVKLLQKILVRGTDSHREFTDKVQLIADSEARAVERGIRMSHAEAIEHRGMIPREPRPVFVPRGRYGLFSSP